MVAAAAFHRVLGHPGGGALRPQLLMGVRDIVREWATDDGISAVLPELRKPTGGRGLRAARSVTPERRQLAERAFQALPAGSQCLLWHTEVEAEPISVPAGLLGVDAARASAALDQARDQFRAGCARAHRELAPTRECRFYNRLLDVPIGRGGALLPDVQRHLAVCRYCRHAAEQLSHFDGGLEVLLAETVLGWGARRYLDSRPGRCAGPGATPTRPAARPRTGGRHRPAPVGFLAPPRRPTKAVLVGAGLVSLALLATVLVARSWSDEGGVLGPRATWGAESGNSVSPGSTAESTSAGSSSAASVGNRGEVGHGRLRNPVAGLCLDVSDRGPEVGAGAETALAACSSAGSQQWSYQGDGLLRSAAYPTLCLDADADEGSVVLAHCVVHAGEVRYDLTVRGELLLRRGKGLLVAPGPGRSVVVAERDGSAGQQWLLESGSGDTGGGARARGATGESLPEVPGSHPAAPGSGLDSDSDSGPDSDSLKLKVPPPPSPAPDADSPRKDSGSTPPQDAPVDPPPRYETRVAQADHRTEPEPAAPAEGAGTLVGEVLGGLTSAATTRD